MFRRRYDAGLPMSRGERDNSNKAPPGFIYTRSHSRNLREVRFPSRLSLFGYIWAAVGLLSFFYGIFALLNSKEVVELTCPIHEPHCTYSPPRWALEKYAYLLP